MKRYLQPVLQIPNKTLGIMGMIGAPFLMMEMLSGSIFGLGKTAAAGICDLIYMLGWTASIIGLIKQNAAGDKKWSRNLLMINLCFLGVACIWNTWEAIDPENNTLLFRILDVFWPASNCLLFITGIIIAIQGKVTGMIRWTPLIAGSWLAFAFIVGNLAGGRNELTFFVIGGYSVIAWFLLALSVYLSPETTVSEQVANRSIHSKYEPAAANQSL